jgi:hypothetical protein
MFGSGRGANRATGADKSHSSAAEPGKAVKAGTAAGAHQLRSGLTKAHFELGQDGKPKQVYPTTPLSGGNVKLEPTALGLASPAAAGAVKHQLYPRHRVKAVYQHRRCRRRVQALRNQK